MLKCPICKTPITQKNKDQSNEKDLLASHIEKSHFSQIPDDMTTYQYIFYLKHGRIHSSCIVCGKPTMWNEKTQKPSRLCGDPKCRESMRSDAVKNNFNKFGDDHPINDINHQIKMQKSKKSAKPYTFKDGNEVITLSKDEYSFLSYNETFLEMTSKDLVECPYTFTYDDNGTTRQYAPDLYLIDYNLIIEIKDDGNSNPEFIKETRYKVKLKADAVEKDNRFNYIIVYGKNYAPYLKMLYQLRSGKIDNKKINNEKLIVHNESIEPIENNLYDLYLGVVHIGSNHLNLFLADDIDLSRLYIGDTNGSLAPTSIYNNFFDNKSVSLFKLDDIKWDKIKGIYSILKGDLIQLKDISPDNFILDLLYANGINFYLSNIVNNNDKGLNDFTLVKSGKCESFKERPLEYSLK